MNAHANPFRGLLFGVLISIGLWIGIIAGLFKGMRWVVDAL